MIEGLERLLWGRSLPGTRELRDRLQDLLGGGASGRLVDQQALQRRGRRVFRLRFAVGGASRSVVIKRLKPEIARRTELAATRWLPAVGMADCGPPWMGTAAASDGACVWHVYEDLGPWDIHGPRPDPARVKAALTMVARMHARFAEHALLGDVRLHGDDLGIPYLERNLRDALRALEAWRPRAGARRALRGRLMDRLGAIEEELPRQARALASLAGPETLLHGDLWAINIFVMPTRTGQRARLIDWDHAAVGPATYDLSTLLLRFPPADRAWMLAHYREAVGRSGRRLPPAGALDLVFAAHEQARYANRVIWPAIALAVDGADWGCAELAEIERWFERYRPVLGSARARRRLPS